MKRPRSPSPDSVRAHSPTLDSSRTTDLPSLISHQEIFLRILSFLDPTHLANVQGVNKYWASMSLDPQLWKRLYLQRYPHPHHTKLIYKSDNDANIAPSRPNTPRSASGLRPIARLPSRAFPPPSPSRSPSASLIRPIRSTAASTITPTPGRSAGTGHAIPLSRSEAARITDQDQVGSGVRNDGVDWKMMLRLGTNWSRGNASSQTTITLPPSPSPSITSTDILPAAPDPSSNQYSSQHIALSPSFIFTSNPMSPLVHVYPSSNPSVRLGIVPPPPGWSSPSRPDNITAIAADQSVTPLDSDQDEVGHDLPARLAVFYQSGGYVVLSISTNDIGGSKRLIWTRESVFPPTARPASLRRRTINYAPPISGDPVVLAVLHHPVLITCTLAFHLSVYTLPAASSGSSMPKHLSTLHSGVSFHPAALSLFPTSPDLIGRPPTPQSGSGDTDFRASLTYCTPVYPSSWTVAAQEFEITLSGHDELEGQVTRAECYHVGHSDDDGAAEEEEIVWPRKIKPIIAVKGRRATGIGTDGRWCVLSGRDNQIQVYALPHSDSPLSPPPSPSPTYHPKKYNTREGKIHHRQTLLAHNADVTSLALTAGRCVSGGSDGRVLVWDLDNEGNTDETGSGRIGRTVGYVEVRTGQERVWRGAAGPRLPISRLTDEINTVANTDNDDDGDADEAEDPPRLPHPQAISGAARSLFLPRPPELERRGEEVRPAIRQLTFDEERIVGLVRSSGVEEVMKVWNFNG